MVTYLYISELKAFSFRELPCGRELKTADFCELIAIGNRCGINYTFFFAVFMEDVSITLILLHSLDSRSYSSGYK